MAVTSKAKFAYVANNLGGITGYSLDASTGALTPLAGFSAQFGGQPSFLTHDPQNRFVFMTDELGAGLHSLVVDTGSGNLKEAPGSPYLAPKNSNIARVDPSGTHIYAIGFGVDQIVAYTIDPNGALTAVPGSPFALGTGKGMADIAIDTTGSYLYAQSDGIYTFSIDPVTGALSLLRSISLGTGNGLMVDPAGGYLYAISTNLLALDINPTTGALTLIAGSPYATKETPYSMVISPTGQYAFSSEDAKLVTYGIYHGTFTPIGPALPQYFSLGMSVDPTGSFLYVPQFCISGCPSWQIDATFGFSVGSTGVLGVIPGNPFPGTAEPASITMIGQ